MSDMLVLKQDWSEGMLTIALAVFGVAIFMTLKWRSDDPSFAHVEWWLIAIWATFWIVIVGIQIRRIHTKMVWACLSPDGVFNIDGEKLTWDEVTEIRFLLGQIWIGQNDKTFPFVSLSASVIGQAKMDEAERYIRQHAPAEKIREF